MRNSQSHDSCCLAADKYGTPFHDKMDIIENLKRKRTLIAEQLMKDLASQDRGQHILEMAARESVQQCLTDSFNEAFLKATHGREDVAFTTKIQSVLAKSSDDCVGEK